MARAKTIYICQQCGATSPKWIGRCPSCKEWNTYVEERLPGKTPATAIHSRTASIPPLPLSEVKSSEFKRTTCGMKEFNRILGGGFVPGSLILLGGEPGIGKSTLALQVAMQLLGGKTLYVSGEESPEQIKIRADRMNLNQEKCLIYGETLFENIADEIHKIKPALVVVDSVQTMRTEEIESSPGSVSQVRESASRLLLLSKETGIPVLLIGHITKDGSIAGPKILEHIVDVVLQFEGNQQHLFRMLRVLKNRFGSTAELALFEMKESGLQEITNPSEILLSHLNENRLSGITAAATLDGTRPFMIEVQALVSTAVYSAPQRTVTGFDLRRLHILLAVMEKRGGFRLSSKDVFLNIAGGIRVDDTAIDLSVTAAVLSSLLDIPVDNRLAFAAEISLSGEIRPVIHIEKRIQEAARHGFKYIMISGYNANKLNTTRTEIQIIPVNKIDEMLKKLFSNKS